MAVSFPKGYVQPPTQAQQFAWYLRDHLGSIIAAGRPRRRLLLLPVRLDPRRPRSAEGHRRAALGAAGARVAGADELHLEPRPEAPGLSGAFGGGDQSRGRRLPSTRMSATRSPCGAPTSRRAVSASPSARRRSSASSTTTAARSRSTSGTATRSPPSAPPSGRRWKAEHRAVFYRHNYGWIVPGIALSVLTVLATLFFGNLSGQHAAGSFSGADRRLHPHRLLDHASPRTPAPGWAERSGLPSSASFSPSCSSIPASSPQAAC